MTRASHTIPHRKRVKKILDLAKGYRGRANNCYRVAKQKVEKALQYAYRDRRARKRDFRQLWITRLNGALHEYGLKYSVFIYAIGKMEIGLDRKSLSELAIQNPEQFSQLVSEVKKFLEVNSNGVKQAA